ncbi:MAG: hypothetical protein LUI15_04730 [Firmicutes bacterium]|nr:hypothetical protein [Bacillota bacterium]
MVIKMNSYQNRGGRNYRRGGKQRGGAKNIMSEVSAELDEGAASDDSADAPTRRQYSQKNGRRQNQKASGQGGRQGADAAKKEQPIPLYKQIRGSGAKL